MTIGLSILPSSPLFLSFLLPPRDYLFFPHSFFKNTFFTFNFRRLPPLLLFVSLLSQCVTIFFSLLRFSRISFPPSLSFLSSYHYLIFTLFFSRINFLLLLNASFNSVLLSRMRWVSNFSSKNYRSTLSQLRCLQSQG